MLRVEGVLKSFGDFKALRGADLAVEKGEMVAVIGPNGAGKTTLFNLITGQLKPDGGRITFKGEDLAALPPHHICRRGVARSFQVANVFPRLSVFHNVQVSVLSRMGKSGRAPAPDPQNGGGGDDPPAGERGPHGASGRVGRGSLPRRPEDTGDGHSPGQRARAAYPR